MKYTNLDIVQNVLSRLDSDEVNSISDTTESRQVAELVKTKYFDIVSRAHLPEHKQMFQLVASADPTLPVVMYQPSGIRTVEWIKYHRVETNPTIDDFTYVTILPLQQFIDRSHALNLDEVNVDSLTLNSFTFYFMNDRQPCYCTIVNDDTIVFDSYDADVDTTLQSSKTIAFGLINPTFTMVDSFIPDLDDAQFPLLLNEVTAAAFADLKQTINPKVEQEVRRQWSSFEKTKYFPKPNYLAQLPNFGRKTQGMSSPNRWMRER